MCDGSSRISARVEVSVPPRKARIAARRLIVNHGFLAMQAACDLYDAALDEGDLIEAEHWEDVKVAIGNEES